MAGTQVIQRITHDDLGTIRQGGDAQQVFPWWMALAAIQGGNKRLDGDGAYVAREAIEQGP